jgi:hypothetical protein
MGFFSWKTADTDESIANEFTDHENAGRPVFLLQPDGQAPIREDSYEGYGTFGGVDAYEWLSEMNIGVKDRDLGIALDGGTVLRDMHGNAYVCGMHTSDAALAALKSKLPRDVTLKTFANYGATITVDGVTAEVNAMTEQGVLKRTPFNELVPVRYPLKFSFNENARYEALSASDNCPDQGFFY